MTISKAVVMAAIGPLALSAMAQMIPLKPEEAPNDPLVLAFSSCVTALGLTQDIALTEPQPAIQEPGRLLILNDVGKIRDGYRHFLYVPSVGPSVYIVQIGGIAGTTKVFGPLQRDAGCASLKK